MRNASALGKMSLNNDLTIWCVIPVFNNKSTLRKIAQGCRERLRNVLVVDDGSTDCNVNIELSGLDVTILKHQRNRGKGYAIRTALDFVLRQGAEFMITIDADGQHYPQDLDKFIPVVTDNQDSIIIGCRDFSQTNIPPKSKFGRSFSNFWIGLETGVFLKDSQSGFRAYPVEHLSKMKLRGNHYDFEAEVLARGVWAGLKLKEIPVNVYYPEAKHRVSSFRPFLDNLRISLMHSRLIGRRLLPFPYPKLVKAQKASAKIQILRHPVRLLKQLLEENNTPLGLAVAAGVGMFLGVLPLVSVHLLTIVYVTSRLHLNKIMALAIQNLCTPPFVPIACIELGHFMRSGEWLTGVSVGAIFSSIPEFLWEWFLGSLILAPLLAVIIAVIVYFIGLHIQNNKANYAESIQ
jgi:glycosyltransferase involved in cell wall biosynthesis